MINPNIQIPGLPDSSQPGHEEIEIDGQVFARGGKVVLRLGKRRSDAADMLIDNRVATIENIFSDYDGKVYLAVTMDEDPARHILREMKIYRYFLTDEAELINS